MSLIGALFDAAGGFASRFSRQAGPLGCRYRLNKPFPVVRTLRTPQPWLLLPLAAVLLSVHAVKDVLGPDAGTFGTVVSAWFQPVAFLSCGIAVVWSAARRDGRRAWILLGAGLTLYAAGNVYYNLAFADVASPPFPSLADGLWLALYPLAFAALATLLRGRFKHLTAAVWLDGVIGGGVVAAAVAAVVFNSVFDVTIAGGAASIARLAYPIGDLVMVGVVIAVWSVTGRRLAPLWGALGLGFGLLAIGDSAYVVQAAHGSWAPGNGLDYPYALGTMLIAAAAWLPTPEARSNESQRTGVGLPVACGLAALALTSVVVLVGLNPLATMLSLITMLAVVMRLGSTLARVNRQSSELAALAATDPLTGLPNHRTVHEQLARELKRARGIAAPLSVVTIDIDHFKSLNDTYGHTEGDAALQAIADVLSRQVSGRELVGRVGGEEFVLVLPETEANEAFAVAERCRAALSDLSVHGAGLSCSAGVASFPADDEEGTRLLELADGALYWAKRSGRAQTRRYDPREVILLSSGEQRAQVQAVIDSADALQPVFQPIVELATGRIAGYEALTRFTGAEPARAPDLWFAQARRCGLGPALEAKALAVALAVPGRPAGTFLSLNVSPGALVSAEVGAVLPRDLSNVVIELTEDEVFSSDIALDATLSELRDRGGRIAVDDAGAGYAGLQQVVRVAPEILKIDRSLITGIDADASKMALVEALARFASTTGAAVCGEGIETVEELRMLARADATYAQGYALARPGPAWPDVDATMADVTAAELSMGMRVPRVEANAPLSLGDVAAALGQVRSREELNQAVAMIERLLHADDVTVSRVVPGERCVETVTSHDGIVLDERYSFDDYPTTAHVIEDQVLGQLVVDDPSADDAERRLLADLGWAALLMVPVVSRGTSVGLLEISRRAGRPWTSAEIDQARLLAQSLAATMRGEVGPEPLPWSPDSFGARAPR
jgi:diguanylate cyclase (GGDEF)-like protein